MTPLILLGVAVAFLVTVKKSNAVSTVAAVPSDTAPTNLTPTPTFASVPLPTKTKATTEKEAAPIVGISPPAPGSSPPYVTDYSGAPEFSTFGTMESEPSMFLTESEPTE